MRTSVFSNSSAKKKCSEQLAALFKGRPLVVAIDPCNDVFGLFENLRDEYPPDPVPFSEISFIMLKELGLPGRVLTGRFIELLKDLGADENKIFVPDFDDISFFEKKLLSFGRIDETVLGLRNDSGLLFNEVGALFEAKVRKQKLLKATYDYLQSENSGCPKPEFVYTCGIKTVTDSKNISVFAFGKSKADAVYKTLYSRTDSLNPAAFLQIPVNVTLYLDEDAASML